MVGGYKVVDLKNINLTTSSTKIPGTYRKIESSVGKPVLLRGITINGVDRHSAFCQIDTYGQDFVLAFSIESSGNIFFVRVNHDDLVSYTVYNPASSTGDPPVSGEDGPSASM